MIECNLPLLVHGEVTGQNIDIFDREKVFIERYLRLLAERYPELKIVMEHITTAAAFVTSAGANIAATSGSSKFFLGTDSAPHTREAKENPCGCAGCYSAFGALEIYAEVFDQAGALDRLEGFASYFGADFYDLPRNSEKITLERKTQPVPDSLPMGDSKVVPLRAGEHLQWTLCTPN